MDTYTNLVVYYHSQPLHSMCYTFVCLYLLQQVYLKQHYVMHCDVTAAMVSLSDRDFFF